ncbi:MAG: M20/M25/M40 family metallo-hydrolase [Dysgonomonas sp.]
MKYKIDNEGREFLFQLLNASAPSGCESEAALLFKSYIQLCCDTVETDAMGNVVGVINPTSPHKLLVSAHIDEVGLQVTGIKDDGSLTFRCIGGLDILSLYGQHIIILTEKGKIKGAIGRNKDHTNYDNSGATCLKQSDLWIDIGASNKQEAIEKVSIGDYATFAANASMLTDTVICSKALDNRLGVFVISQVARMLLREEPDCAIYIAATVQEEIGTRGMALVANKIKPHIGLVVDCGHAGNNNDDRLMLGDGTALIRNADNHTGLVNEIRQTAHAQGLGYQLSVGNNITGGTDSSRLQLFGGDVRVADISIPCKYMHSHCEIADLRDVENTINLLFQTIKQEKLWR